MYLHILYTVQVTYNFNSTPVSCVSCESHSCVLSGYACGLIVLTVYVICTHFVHVQWSTPMYSDPHPCALLQNYSLCRQASLWKIDHLSTKNAHFSYMHHHNLITIFTNTLKSFSLLRNLIGFLLLQFTETEFYTGTWRY